MSKEREADEWDKWDPMGLDYEYGLIFDGGRIGSRIKELFANYEIPEKDILCTNFYEPGGTCYKQHCQKSHPICKEKEFDMSTGLKKKKEHVAHYVACVTSPAAKNLTTCLVKIQLIESPWNFHCNPLTTDELACCCDCPIEEEEDEEGDFDLESRIRKCLTYEFRKDVLSNSGRRSEFVEQQIVAVRRTDSQGRIYLSRGIMCEHLELDVFNGQRIKDCWGKVYFCDTGETMEVPLLDIMVLDPCWINIAPLATHCSLAGISPRGIFWSNEETDYFSSLVKGKNVLMRVFHKVSKVGFKTKKPTVVHLFVKDEKSNNYQSVATLMKEKFAAAGKPETLSAN